MDFIIDTVGETEKNVQTEGNDNEAFLTELLKDFKESSTPHKQKINERSIAQEIIDDLRQVNKKRFRNSSKELTDITDTKSEIRDILKKSVVLDPGFNSLHSIPSYDISQKKLQKERKAKTKGKKWFGLPATEMTEEVKHDLEILQMRSVLDPKHFYKKNDLNVLPKYFQIGKVMDSPLDFYNNRLPKKQRKKTLVDELLADAKFNKYNKRKYKEIIEEKQKTHYKAWRTAKRLKKKA
ncbi:hypothetical protein NQ317_001604 [Molorchus minor]|uniref:Fcf2 pre-rRNA processing C-terminal domain-containing protein n=1 Tax=Molorchus minor TaxID=1323400 RepID=A0ABQ9J683_9CUCU|nr:hypothetical protein NQ317_001604 [Molorchus minor]